MKSLINENKSSPVIEVKALKNALLDSDILSVLQKQSLHNSIHLINENDDKIEALLTASVGVKRQFGEQFIISYIKHDNVPIDFLSICQSFTLAEVIRFLYILLTLEQNIDVKLLAKNYYQYGDESEKVTLLKLLTLFDRQGEVLQTAIKACRCNSLVEFSAIALRNDFPAYYFPELNFNQLVLKSLFMGLEIDEINGLSTRLNEKLSNMCFAYAVEQALAERNLPSSVWQAIRINDLDTENNLLVDKYLTYFANLAENHQQQIETLIKQQSLSILL